MNRYDPWFARAVLLGCVVGFVVVCAFFLRRDQ